MGSVTFQFSLDSEALLDFVRHLDELVYVSAQIDMPRSRVTQSHYVVAHLVVSSFPILGYRPEFFAMRGPDDLDSDNNEDKDCIDDGDSAIERLVRNTSRTIDLDSHTNSEYSPASNQNETLSQTSSER